VEFHAIGLLSALGTSAFASASPASRASAGFAAAAFLTGLAGVSATTPPATAGGLAVAAAALQLWRPQWRFVAPLAAGTFAAVWSATLATQGLLFVAGIVLAATLMGASSVLAARLPKFAPDGLRDEAAVVVGILGLAVLVGGELVAGWRTGTALAAQPLEAANVPLGVGLAAIVAGVVALGGVYTFWTRR
jgi:hypothetical protein